MRRFRKHHYGTVQMASSPSLHACCAGGQETPAQGLHRAAHGEQTRIWFCRFFLCGRKRKHAEDLLCQSSLFARSRWGLTRQITLQSTVVCVDAAFVSALSSFGRQWSIFLCECANRQPPPRPPPPLPRLKKCHDQEETASIVDPLPKGRLPPLRLVPRMDILNRDMNRRAGW